MEEEINAFDLPETTVTEIIDKIDAMAHRIREDWSDPRSECRTIWRLCARLKELLIRDSGDEVSDTTGNNQGGDAGKPINQGTDAPNEQSKEI